MSARLSVDPDLVRAYGSAAAAHAADLRDAAARLADLPAAGAGFGPVGSRFLGVLARAAADEARTVSELSRSLSAAREAAVGSAGSYERADAGASNRIGR